MHTSFGFMGEAFFKRYSIPIGVVGLALTAMSTFGIQMTGQFEAYKFWAAVWLLVAINILVLIALNLSVKKLNNYENCKFNIGELPPVLSISSMNDGENAKIILHPKENIILQKDTVVTILFSDEQQGDIELGLGVVVDHQADGRLGLVATPKRRMQEQWNEVLKNTPAYTNKLRVRTIIDRNYVNDDYLYKENYEIGKLSESAKEVTSDGDGTKI